MMKKEEKMTIFGMNGWRQFIRWIYQLPFLQALRQSVILLMPVILLYSLSSAALSQPVADYLTGLHSGAASSILEFLHQIHHMTADYYSLFLVLVVGLCYARQRQLPFCQQAFMALLCLAVFLLFTENPDMPREVYFSTYGVFSCLFSCILAGPLYARGLQWSIKWGTGRHSRMHPLLYTALISCPALLAVLVVAVVIQSVFFSIWQLPVQEFFSQSVYTAFLYIGGSSFMGALFFQEILHFFWFLGIPGLPLFADIQMGYYQNLLCYAIQMADNGIETGFIINNVFINTFVLIGGPGAVLALLGALFLFGRSKTTGIIARTGCLPAFFNIGDVLVFGVPVMWNPVFLVPFMLIPLVNMSIAYYLTTLGLLPVVAKEVAWTVPLFLNGFLATGSYMGPLVQALLLGIDFFIYAPFVWWDDKEKDVLFIERVHTLESILLSPEGQCRKSRLTELPGIPGLVAQALINDLTEDLSRGRLRMVYQGRFDGQGAFAGAEALLRWPHDRAGLIHPRLLVALAIEGGLLPELEQFVFHEACQAARNLQNDAGVHGVVSVHISGASLAYGGMEEAIDQAVSDTAIRREQLWLEITEQDVLFGTDGQLAAMGRLKAMGHTLILEKFGANYRLSPYIQDTSFDVVKLDQGLIGTMTDNTDSLERLQALISLGKSNNILVLAPCVETEEQLETLQQLGCNLFQGILYGKPVALAILLSYLQKKKTRSH